MVAMPLLLAAAVCCNPSIARAAPEGPPLVAVVYPDLGEPYRAVFQQIVDGVQERARGRVTSLAVGPSTSAADLSGELRRRDVRSVILLGRLGLRLAGTLERSLGVVAGGVVSLPEAEAQGFPVYSLAPDPQLLFARLRQLAPTVRRVVVVFDPRQNAWLVRLARDAARVQGLELLALEAGDLKAAVRHYQDWLGSADTRRDALWLPQDSTTVEESVVLPLVLRESWDQGLAVFSSNVAHVRRGALFALYPDNPALGRSMAAAVMASAGGNAAGAAPSAAAPAGSRLLPLRDVLTAVNTRTAAHLGISLPATGLRFDLVFPEP